MDSAGSIEARSDVGGVTGLESLDDDLNEVVESSGAESSVDGDSHIVQVHAIRVTVDLGGDSGDSSS